MKILQNDIFGNSHDTKPEKEKKPPMAAPKNFPTISLRDGLNESQANADAMLFHRILQKKMIYEGLKTERQRNVFMKILKNELSIKAGLLDSVSASRDSLIAFYITKSKN